MLRHWGSSCFESEAYSSLRSQHCDHHSPRMYHRCEKTKSWSFSKVVDLLSYCACRQDWTKHVLALLRRGCRIKRWTEISFLTCLPAFKPSWRQSQMNKHLHLTHFLKGLEKLLSKKGFTWLELAKSEPSYYRVLNRCPEKEELFPSPHWCNLLVYWQIAQDWDGYLPQLWLGLILAIHGLYN